MRMRWLARALKPRMLALAAQREPDLTIAKEGGQDLYLQRWWVIRRNRWFNIYLHRMLKDDDDVLHDHMYVSLSLVLGDGILERYCPDPGTYVGYASNAATGNYDRRVYQIRERRFKEGDLVWRSSKLAHQLVIKEETWTIFMTGPRIKEWGFWCPGGFRHWKRYVQDTYSPDGRGQVTARSGVGCGEQS